MVGSVDTRNGKASVGFYIPTTEEKYFISPSSRTELVALAINTTFIHYIGLCVTRSL